MQKTIRAVIGSSGRADAIMAGKEAAQRARAKLDDSGTQFALVFGSSWFHQEHLLRGVHSVLQGLPLIGGSTAGEITAEGSAHHSCVVILIASDHVIWATGTGKDVNRAPRQAGHRAAYTAVEGSGKQPRVGFLMFGDGLATGYTEVMRGIQEVLGTKSFIVGGLAGDDQRFTRTYQYINTQVVTDSVVGALLTGPVKMGVGIQHGFAPVSKPRTITKARGNLLYEIDHQPAASVYEEYVGREMIQRMQAEGSTRQGHLYPLGLQGEAPDQYLIRNVLSLPEDGSLLCSDEIPEGTSFQLMIGNKQLAVDAARRAAEQAIKPLKQVELILIFDSALRPTLLGQQQAASEVTRIRQIVGPSVPLAGCYTYGEHAPLTNTNGLGRTTVQTSTVLVLALGT